MKTFKRYFKEGSEIPFSKANLKKMLKDGKGFVVFGTGSGRSDTKEFGLTADEVKNVISKGKEDIIINNAERAVKSAKDPKMRDRKFMIRLDEAKLPKDFITDIRVEPSIIDEWYGVSIRFKWGKSGQPKIDDEYKLVQAIATEVKKTSQYRKFRNWAKKASVTANTNGSDATPRDVIIPDFEPRDYDDWSFDGTGGWISASERD